MYLARLKHMKGHESMKAPAGRPRNIGLAAGSFWLIAISSVFIVWSLVAIGTATATSVLLGGGILLVALLVAGALVIRVALALPAGIASQPNEGPKIWRKFAWVVGAEVAGFALVNSIAGATGNFELMPSLNLIVVGIHFFPLARLFRVPRYNITGMLFCAIPCVMLLAVSKQAVVGQALAWYVVRGLGCGCVACMTAVAGLREAWLSISESRTPVA
jgi:hypothetical protein